MDFKKLSLADLWDIQRETYDSWKEDGDQKSKTLGLGVQQYLKKEYGDKVASDAMMAAIEYWTYSSEWPVPDEPEHKKAVKAEKLLRKKHQIKEETTHSADVIEDITEEQLLELGKHQISTNNKNTIMEKTDIDSIELFEQYAAELLESHDSELDAVETIKSLVEQADSDYTIALELLESYITESKEDDKEEDDKEDDKEEDDDKEDDKEEEEEDDKEEVSEDASLAVFKGLLDEDVSLSDEFKEKAVIIFESAVNAKVKAEKAALTTVVEERLISEVEKIKTTLEEQVDGYLTAQSEVWINENKVAVESSLRNELAEEFIGGLKTLFESSYVEIPEDKIDLVEKLQEEVSALQESSSDIMTQLSEAHEELETIKREKILTGLTEDLTDVQVEKFNVLIEDVHFTDAETFERKAQIIKEYFIGNSSDEIKPATKPSSTVVKTLVEEDEGETKKLDPVMAAIVESLGKLNKSSSSNLLK